MKKYTAYSVIGVILFCITLFIIRLCLSVTDNRRPDDILVLNITTAFQEAKIKAVSASDIFQPTKEQQRTVFKSIKVSDPTDHSVKIVEGIPYSWYPTIPDKSLRLIHPSIIARTIFNKTESDPEQALVDAKEMEKVSMHLPNGGLAWYYSRYFDVSRIRGPDLIYSGMTAGDILGAYSNIGLKQGFDEVPKAKAVFLSLTFPWQEGGVSLYGKTILEVPLFRSAPEVVLNGWLHTLLQIHDYAILSNDREAYQLLDGNIKFLAETLEQYDVPQVKLSRYSDLSPYKVRISYDDDIAPEFEIFYRTKKHGFDNLVYPIKKLNNPAKPSIYDNQILKNMPEEKALIVSISCSQKYETILMAKSRGFRVNLKTGIHDWVSTTPNRFGNKIKLRSYPANDGWQLLIFDNEALRLNCGMPTNFSKVGNENYYHVQHVVALLYLASIVAMTEYNRCSLVSWALKWHGYMEQIELPDGVSFTNPQSILNSINAGKPVQQVRGAKQLLMESYEWHASNCASHKHITVPNN